jgi:putative nucleotidyltransferase with HDIG domain
VRKKIAVEDLCPGMWVVDLDRPWRETPFLFQGFEIKDDADLEQLRRFCRHVVVELPESHEHVAVRHAVAPSPPRMTIQYAESPSTAPEFGVLRRFTAEPARAPAYPDRVTLEQELPRAREIARQSKVLVQDILEDIRVGQSLDTAGAKQAVSQMVESILDNPDALVCLGQLKNKDQYTAEHALRVCVLALAFGRHLELEEAELNVLGVGAMLHDIGKTKVPTEILNKPGRLTARENELMKLHVAHGVEILEKSAGIPPASVEVARNHHERFDGTGYAAGLKGEQIGLFGSIGAIVDCYDAITSNRAYHTGMSPFDALNRMYTWRAKEFHPELIEQFIQCMGVYPIGSIVELDTGAVGVVISVNRFRRLRPKVALVLNADKTAFQPFRVLDLMQLEVEPGAPHVEIRHVLPMGAFGINPVDYLPQLK